jgi:predicted transposase YbfD/YdcC
MGWLVKQFPQWKSIKSTGVVETRRDAGEGVKTERRYFISSLSADEEWFAHAVRSHWRIENRLHYMLACYIVRIPAGRGMPEAR